MAVPKTPAEKQTRPQQVFTLVVEVGHARVRVMAGFDTKLLAEVVAALGGDR